MLVNLQFKTDDIDLVVNLINLGDKMKGLDVLECAAICSNGQIVKLSNCSEED